MKRFFLHYKLFGLLILILIILIPAFIFAYNTPQTGYKAVAGGVSGPMFYEAEDGGGIEYVGFCVKNDTTKDYFIPTAHYVDAYSFFSNKPTGLLLVTCIGDGQCTYPEDCSTAPSDCGSCDSGGGDSGGGGSAAPNCDLYIDGQYLAWTC